MKSACVVCNVRLDVEISIQNGHIKFNEEREDDGDNIFEIFCNYFNFPFQTNYRPQQQRELTRSQCFCDTCKIVVEQLRQCHRTLQSVQAQIVKIIATLTCKIIDTTTTIKCVNSTSSSVKFTSHDDLQNNCRQSDDNELLRAVQRLRQSIYHKYSPHLIVPKCSKKSSSTRKSSKIARKQGNKEETNVTTHNQIVKEQVTINDNDDDLSVHHFDDHEDSPEEVHPPVHEDEDTIDVNYLDDDEVDPPEDEQKKSDCDYNPSPESSVYDDDDDDDGGGDADYEEELRSTVKKKGRNKRKPRIVKKRKNNVTGKKKTRQRRKSNDDDNNKEFRDCTEVNCRRCGLLCVGQRNLKLHINEAHKEYYETNLSCPFCKDSRPVQGQDSEKNENGDDIQSRQPEKIYTHQDFVVHINSVHSDKRKLLYGVIQVGVGKFLYFKRCLFEERDDKLLCLHCHMLIEGGQDQMIHHLEITHIHPPLFVCEVCGKSCSAKSLLAEHASSHSSDRPFICEVCGFGAKTLRKLCDHQRKIHSEGRSFKCPHCPKAYKSRSLLYQHTSSGVHQGDGGKIFECPHCSKKFALIHSRTRHIKNFHTAERQRTKNHPCPECNKLFFTRTEVTQHLIRCPILVGPRQRRTFPKIPDGNNQTANNERNEDEVLMDIPMAEMQNEIML